MDLEPSFPDEMDAQDANATDQESQSELDASTLRKKRREGIYGIEALLPPNSNINPQGASAATALRPPGNNYMFGGVPSYPHVYPAGGQYPFGFRTERRFSTSTEGVSPHDAQSLQPPMGTGRSGFASQPFHNNAAQDAAGLQPDTNAMSSNAQEPPFSRFERAPYVDMDRDERGNPLSMVKTYGPFRPPAHHGIYPRPADRPFPPLPPVSSFRPAQHLANPESLVPENMYMSPNRIAHAQHHARISLKRKRPETILPPQSYVYRRTNDPNFNIFHGILLYPELVFALATQLPVRDLVSLYAISRDFHVILDTRFTTVMLSQATAKAPESAQTYPFRAYAHLCRKDPAARIPHPNARQAAKQVPRKIPSFRWLRMVLHREKVVHEMMAVFAEGGVPLPFRCSLALKRIWFLMDIPDNARRIGAIHNPRLMTDMDVYFGNCFVTKLDMLLNDPVVADKRDGLRKLLLGQRSLTTMVRVLKRDIWTSRLDVMREWVKFKFTPAEDERGLSIFGIPAGRVGRGCLEYWGRATAAQLKREPQKLYRPDQLLIREAYRRGMRLEKHFLRFMLYGYVRPDTLENWAPRTYGRRIDALKDDEYEIDDLIGGVAALGVRDHGYDPLLDLGKPRQGSVYTIVKEQMSKKEKELRKRDAEFTKKCLEWWDRERRAMTDAELHWEDEDDEDDWDEDEDYEDYEDYADDEDEDEGETQLQPTGVAKEHVETRDSTQQNGISAYVEDDNDIELQ